MQLLKLVLVDEGFSLVVAADHHSQSKERRAGDPE